MRIHFPETDSASFIRFYKGCIIDERLSSTASEAVMRVLLFVLPRILTCFLACVCVWFWILRPDNFTGVSLWDVFPDGEPIWGWKISGDSILNRNLFRSRRRLFHWNSMVTFCARWCQAEEGPWRGRWEVAQGRGGKLNTRDAQFLYFYLNMPEVIEFLLVFC